MTIAIRVESLSKRFLINRNRPREEYTTLAQTLGEWLTLPFRQLRAGAALGSRTEEFVALDDVSFDVSAGEVVGIIGRNGAGKSTLLKILSEITTPTAGRVELYGRVGSLLEVGTGFHPELTGHENVFLNGSILGMSRREIERQYDAIVDFAGVHEFLETPVKRYSSGMKVRLAFAVAAHLNPEILLIDEVLAVGDAEFQRKCLGKMSEVATSGRTVVFVSHDMTAVRNLCTRVLRFERGRLVHDDEPSIVINEYLKGIRTGSAFRDLTGPEVERTGSGEARIERIEVCTSLGETSTAVAMGEGVRIRAVIRSRAEIAAASVGIGIFDAMGTRVAGVNSEEAGGPAIRLRAGRQTVVECLLPEMNLMPGTYRINFNLHRATARDALDFVRHAIEFDVIESDVFGTGRAPNRNAVVFLHSRWEVRDATFDPTPGESRAAASAVNV